MLLTELDFLLDDKVSSEIEKEPEGQQLLVKMNVLRKVLAVKEEAEMYRLLMDVYTKARRRDDGKTVIEGASKMSHSVVEDPQANQPEKEKNIDIDHYNAREFDANESQEEDFNDDVCPCLYRRKLEGMQLKRNRLAKKNKRLIYQLSRGSMTQTRSLVFCPNSLMIRGST